MLFSAPLFIFLFLPVVLLVYGLLPGIRARNWWLLAASLVFYTWGEIGFILILLISVLANYCVSSVMERSESTRRKHILTVGICINLGLLGFFKYFNFGINVLNLVIQALGLKPVAQSDIPLPLGISFFTFHALSYLVDVYRQKRRAASNPFDLALYIFFFPQLIAGPILRWEAIAPQLIHREHSLEKFAEGVRRFVKGLAKKVLIANTVALPSDQIFALPSSQLTAADAWLGTICYTLQIYFDFSSYSDMAVGLGKMFGFHFLENFNFPYISQSIREFWRRWHISLSTWFRDYVYVPLGGNRVSNAHTCLNLLIVFFLCGLWHGASLSFVVWGLYHGLFLVLERTALGTLIGKAPRLLRHLYTLLVAMIGWVIFRSDNFTLAANHLYAMAGLNQATTPQPCARYASGQALCAIFLGVICSVPWREVFHPEIPIATVNRPLFHAVRSVVEFSGVVILFVLSVVWLAGDTYNPFIYFRF